MMLTCYTNLVFQNMILLVPVQNFWKETEENEDFPDFFFKIEEESIIDRIFNN